MLGVNNNSSLPFRDSRGWGGGETSLGIEEIPADICEDVW